MGGFYGGFGLSLSDVLQEFAKDHPIQEVTALDAYTDIFRLGDESNKRIQWYGEEAETRDLVANPLVYCKNNGAKHGQYRVLFLILSQRNLHEHSNLISRSSPACPTSVGVICLRMLPSSLPS